MPGMGSSKRVDHGKIDKLTFNLGPAQLTSDDQKLMRRALEKARD
jgi:arylsulfatase